MLIELILLGCGAAAGICLDRILVWRREQKTREQDYATYLKHNTEMWNKFSDALPVHVYIKNADDEFRYVFSNRKRDEFFGLKPNELLGRNDRTLLSEAGAETQLAADAEIMKKPQGIYEGNVEALDKNGRTSYFRIAQTQFTDETGTHLLLGAAIDVTEQVEAARALEKAKQKVEEREQWLVRTLQSIGDAVIVTDNEGRIQLLNPVAERMMGVKMAQAAGRPHEEVFRIVGAQDNEPRSSPVGRVLRTGVIVELANHTDLLSSDGTRYHISDSAAPILDDRKQVQGAVLVFRDVTEAYRNRAQLREAVRDWEMASTIGGIVSFRINYLTREMTGSKRIQEFWPIKDGKAVLPEQWVMPEDVGNGQDLMRAVAEGREANAFYKYRVKHGDKIRHYRIFGAADPEHTGSMIGIIQDMTEVYENEERLEHERTMWNSLIDILPVNFFSKNADNEFRYEHCNRKFAEFVGKPVEEIVGKTDAELFGQSVDSRHFAEIDRAIIESGRARNFTESAYGAGKRPMQLQTIKMPCVGSNGERLLLGISIDVTEMVRLNKSRDVIHQCLETLVSEKNINEGVDKALKSICDYIGVSRSYILHFDMEQKQVTCERESYPEGATPLLAFLQNVPFSTGMDWKKHFEREPFLKLPDLQDMKTMRLLGPFYSEMIQLGDFRSLYCHRLIIDGKFWGYVGLAYVGEARVLDKNELDFVQSAARFIELMIRHKQTQEELRNAVEQSHAAEKAKSNFLATMSHEIRTPLNAVIGYSELLKDGNLPAAVQKDYVSDIAVAGNALLALINDILDLSKLEAGKMHFVSTPTDVPELLHEVMTIFRQKLREKHLNGRVEAKGIPRVKIDPLRFRQILFNLVGNAVKFTEQGGITVSAAFSANADGKTGTLRFAVRDTGCGISKEDSARLFQPFEQSRAMLGTRVANSGTGLGLALVRRMLDYMNGTIHLDSEPGKGSVFTVELRDVEYSEAATEPEAGTKTEQWRTAELKGYRILLVDDVPMNLKVMHAMLSKLGVEADLAGSGAEALRELSRKPYNLLLTDLWMPGMNGVELAAQVRSMPEYAALHVGVVTADTEVESAVDMSVFDAVLTKPVTLEKLRLLAMKYAPGRSGAK